MKVGVFDSGIGGLSVAQAIEAALPELEVVFVNDKEHVPYGTRTPDEIYGFVRPIIQGLVDEQCEAIVIACNTVSTTLRQRLRADFALPFVMLEPMIKPAAKMTKSGVIVVCATPLTLSSRRYIWLKENFAKSVRVIEPDCADWALRIEHDDMSIAKIRQAVEPGLAEGADVIVLGCTHYHWIQQEIQAVARDRAKVIQPEDAVVAQLKRVLGIV